MLERALLDLILTQPLEQAAQTLRGVEASELERAQAAVAYLNRQTHISRDQALTAFGCEGASLKTPLLALHEFGQVMRGDLGQRVVLGFPSLDNAMRGMRPGQVATIMARSGVGKTTLLLNIAGNIFAGEQPHPVLFCSLEMSAAEIAARLFALSTRQSPRDIESAFCSYAEHIAVITWAQRYETFVICDRPSLSVREIGAMIEQTQEGLGLRIPLVMVDYMQLIKAAGGTAYERTSAIARDLKALAKKHSCAILSACQTSRAGGTGEDRISLSMARDSGVVEEAADFLLGCWRPELSHESEGEASFICSLLKNRHGRMGEVSMHFDKTTLRILEEPLGGKPSV
ncbi:MAG: DnaB-like helicase C-terminal domain-containing protein [Candidatus Geothermincolia bacterium]